MIICRHCEAEAAMDEHETLAEGDTFKCESCGVLGTVFQYDHDVDTEWGPEAVAYLAFRANDGERCSWDECEECR